MIHKNTLPHYLKIVKYSVFVILLVQCEENSPTGNNLTFQAAPSITTLAATEISSEGADLNGTVNPNGFNTTAWFEYSTNSTLSSYTTTVQQSIGEGSTDINVDQELSGLTPGLNYFFRLTATNGFGSSYGNIKSFKVLANYSSISGDWIFQTRDDFENTAFTASMQINHLNLTQTSSSNTSDVDQLTGTISGMHFSLQRRSDGTIYSVFNNASSHISNGGINNTMTGHNLSFNIGGSSDFVIQGVAPGYITMWGDVWIRLDMNTLFGSGDGVITLTGFWDGTRN